MHALDVVRFDCMVVSAKVKAKSCKARHSPRSRCKEVQKRLYTNKLSSAALILSLVTRSSHVFTGGALSRMLYSARAVMETATAREDDVLATVRAVTAGGGRASRVFFALRTLCATRCDEMQTGEIRSQSVLTAACLCYRFLLLQESRRKFRRAPGTTHMHFSTGEILYYSVSMAPS